MFLIEELTNETKALEDVLREKEGKNVFFFFSVHGVMCVCVCIAMANEVSTSRIIFVKSMI